MTRDETTNQLLMLISKHLSGREGCKGQKYILKISESGEYEFSHNLVTYPDAHHRAVCYQDTLMSHIFKYHMNDVCILSSTCNPMLDTTKVVPGIYHYLTSSDKKNRKWFKIG